MFTVCQPTSANVFKEIAQSVEIQLGSIFPIVARQVPQTSLEHFQRIRDNSLLPVPFLQLSMLQRTFRQHWTVKPADLPQKTGQVIR